MEARLTDGSNTESTYVAILPLEGLSTEARNIHNFTATNTTPIISLGVLRGDGYTITLYKQTIEVQKNGKKY